MADRVLVAVAVIAIAATEVGYLLLVRSQGGPPPDTPWVVPFVAGYLMLMAAALAISLVVPEGARPALRAAASAGLLVLGLLAAFSIGLAVLVAAGLAIAALVLDLRATRRSRTLLLAVAGALVAVTVLLVGFEVSWSHVVCPRTDESGCVSTTVSVTCYHCIQGVMTFP